ncbi:LacI family DNA-binding transcriptional regulator [Saccharopolyspora sp. K220]|uniref:LacI family DNA-binding transcriptional regulator n=1 Tax=Saccharopolyspora soli TaxID=2926618 RepID=UPI001F55C608|nr:LacI family DNA-binding transcriptional regulator [Saccharopolyspora soli]MCI2417827.1 LacI family DNA-binding transcriptional regulator [Saccharopolyspora soli]
MSTVRKNRVTISDIAREAGVSVPTVSKVLNGRPEVAAHTRERVEKLITHYNYSRRASHGTGRAGLIDLVFHTLDNQWVLEIVRGVESVTHDAGVGTVVSSVHDGRRTDRAWLDNLSSRRSDGIILAVTELGPRHAELLRGLGVPVIIIDSLGQPDPSVASVGATNWSGARAAVEHLVSAGHHRIGFIGGPPQLQCSSARLDGYRSALLSAEIAVDEELIVDGDFTYERGECATHELLDLADPPTAIFAANDQQALGTYRAVEQRGLTIPGDVSVVGFDDLPMAQWISPALTTVHQPVATMAAQAARMLLRHAETGSFETNRVELATELVVRASTGPGPRA